MNQPSARGRRAPGSARGASRARQWQGAITLLVLVAAALEITGWLFPFATGPRRWVLWLVTPLALLLTLRLVTGALQRGLAARGARPLPRPSGITLGVYGVLVAVVAVLGFLPDQRERRPLTLPRQLALADTLGYRMTLETRLSRWGIAYRLEASCPPARRCAPIYSFGIGLRPPRGGRLQVGQLWLTPESLARPGSHWAREGTLHGLAPVDYREGKMEIVIHPLTSSPTQWARPAGDTSFD